MKIYILAFDFLMDEARLGRSLLPRSVRMLELTLRRPSKNSGKVSPSISDFDVQFCVERSGVKCKGPSSPQRP